MKQVDMSEKAIMSRLRQVDKLRTLCLALMKAKRLHDEKSDEKDTQQKDKSTKTVKK